MMNFLRKYQYHIFLFTMVIFLLGTFIGFGGYFFSSQSSGGEAVAEVNGDKIPLRLFESQYQRTLGQAKTKPGESLDEAARKEKRQEALRELVQSFVLAKEAERYGIRVPDQEVAASLAQVPAFQEKGVFDPRRYLEILRSQLHLPPQDFEEEQRREIAFFKLRWLIQSCIKVTDPEWAMAWAFQGAEFTKANGRATDAAGRKTGPGRTPDAIKELFHRQFEQEKAFWALNRWFSQVTQRVRVKTHLELAEKAAP